MMMTSQFIEMIKLQLNSRLYRYLRSPACKVTIFLGSSPVCLHFAQPPHSRQNQILGIIMSKLAISLVLRGFQILLNAACVAFCGVLLSVSHYAGYIYTMVVSSLSLIWLAVSLSPFRPKWPRLLLVCESLVYAFWITIFGILYDFPGTDCGYYSRIFSNSSWYESYFCYIGKAFWSISVVQMTLILISLMLMVVFNGIPVIGRYGPCGRPSMIPHTYPGGIFDRGVALTLIHDCEASFDSPETSKQETSSLI
ncbi:hypothetical protein DIRU0_C31076 [Diutina rugosa]